MKAQAGLEGMIIAAIIGVVLTFTIVVYAQRTAEINGARLSLEANKICTSVKKAVNEVYSGGVGSRINMNLSQAIFGTDYNLTFYSSDKKMVLSWGGKATVCDVLPINVTNTTHSTFQLKKGLNTFTNRGDAIVIS